MPTHRDEHHEKLSLDEFLTLAEADPDYRYELVDGILYMMPHGSPDHSIIGSNLGRILGNLLSKRPCIVYNSDAFLQLSENTCVCPDVSVSCDRRDLRATKTIQYPTVVVEVLSPGTRVRDRGLKAELYQNVPTIQEILLVETQVMRIQLYRREADYWTIRGFTQDNIVELTSLDVQFPVADVYAKTTFDESFAQE